MKDLDSPAPTPTGDAPATTCEGAIAGPGPSCEGALTRSAGPTLLVPVPAPAVAVPTVQVQAQHEDNTEKSGLRPLSTASTDDAREAIVCVCGHPESSHVPFPTCGDLGWYGCTRCEMPGFPAESGRCLFFRADASRVDPVPAVDKARSADFAVSPSSVSPDTASTCGAPSSQEESPAPTETDEPLEQWAARWSSNAADVAYERQDEQPELAALIARLANATDRLLETLSTERAAREAAERQRDEQVADKHRILREYEAALTSAERRAEALREDAKAFNRRLNDLLDVCGADPHGDPLVRIAALGRLTEAEREFFRSTSPLSRPTEEPT